MSPLSLSSPSVFRQARRNIGDNRAKVFATLRIDIHIRFIALLRSIFPSSIHIPSALKLGLIRISLPLRSCGRQVPAPDSCHETLARRRGISSGVIYWCTAKLTRWFDCVHWPWIQPIRSYIQQTDAESLNFQMGLGQGTYLKSSPRFVKYCPTSSRFHCPISNKRVFAYLIQPQ